MKVEENLMFFKLIKSFERGFERVYMERKQEIMVQFLGILERNESEILRYLERRSKIQNWFSEERV